MSSTMAAATPPVEKVPAYSWYALGLLTVVYVMNFLDRMLIYILLTPIKKEMALNDFQVAMLGAMAFIFFYAALGIPFGRLADRVSRKNLIAGGLAVWSLFSGLTGFADGFWALFLCRLMVGVGEATLGPAALSLLSDYFPVRIRATTQSIYSAAIALGGGLAFFLGGWIGQLYGWRWAFFLLSFPGLIIAVAVYFLREEPRGRTETRPTTQAGADWRSIFRSKPLLYLIAGYALLGLASNNIGLWLPQFFARFHKLNIMTIGMAGGIISIAIGIPTMILGGYYSDRLSRKFSGGRMAFMSILALISVPLWLALLFGSNLVALLAVNVVLYGLALIWVGPATADVHDLAGPALRGLAIGIFFSVIYVSYGIGSLLIGWISDTAGLRLALLVCPTACALGAFLLWLGSRAKTAAATQSS